MHNFYVTPSSRTIRFDACTKTFMGSKVPIEEWILPALAVRETKAGALAWALWWLWGMRKKRTFVPLTPRVLSTFRVDRKTARRILGKWQALGLVDVEFSRGKAPRVRVVVPS